MAHVNPVLNWGLLLALSATGAAGISQASATLARETHPLQAVVSQLEQDGYLIVEGAFDDGRWELEGYRQQESFEILVDPKTGKVLSTRPDNIEPAPPTDAKPLSTILEDLVQKGYQPITSAEFEHGRWEIEAVHDSARRELEVDPLSGKILTDVAD